LSRLAGLGLAVLLCVLASPATSHSLLLESSPAAGATVIAPDQISLRFNNRVEKGLSRLRLVDAAGAAQSLPIAVADHGVDRLTAALPPLRPGRYRVEWQVLSADGHVVSGRFVFTVAP
jgi:methionine-rich copper-binding protein CopC